MENADLHLLDRKLGAPTEGECFLDIPDSHYHKNVEGFSSSALKEYYKDPEYAFSERVRGIADRKPFDEKKKSNFRFGRAVHCAVLEGETPFRQRFPVFGGAQKKGELWEKMKMSHPEALTEDNILTKKEFQDTLDLALVVKPQFDSLFVGRSIIAVFPEISFRMTYASGISFKVRCDFLYIENVNGQLCFRILDLKTCSFAPSSGIDVAFTTSKLGYDLSGVMYYKVVRDCLARPQIVQQLGLQGVISPEGTFELFWVGKESGTTGLHYLLPSQNADGVTWENLGVAKILAALNGYQQMTLRLQNECKHFNQDYQQVQTRRVIAMGVNPVAKEKWVLQDLAGALTPEPYVNLLPSEHEIARQTQQIFKRPLKPTREKPKNEKKNPPAAEKAPAANGVGSWKFTLPTQNAPAQSQAAPASDSSGTKPPATHVDSGGPQDGVVQIPAETLAKYKRKAEFKKFMDNNHPEVSAKIFWDNNNLKQVRTQLKQLGVTKS